MRVLSTSPCASSGSGRAKYQMAKPMMAKESAPVIVAQGLNRDLGPLPRSARLGRGPVER
jgi:hypothetical protein